MIGDFYDCVCVGVAMGSNTEDGELTPMVGLSFPLPNPPHPEDPDHSDNFEDVFLSVAAAKAMLVDLRDAVDSIVEKKPFSTD